METNLIQVNSAITPKEAWIEARDAAMQSAASISEVKSDLEFDKATSVVARLGDLRKELEAERKQVTAPIDKLKKGIMEQEKVLAANIEGERERLRVLASRYATEREKERQKQLEQQQQWQAEDEMSRQMFGGGTTLPAVEVDARLRSSTARQVVVYSFEVTDPSKLDRKFLSPDEKKIRAFVQYLKAQGVDPDTVSEPGLVIRKEIRIDSK